MYYHSGDALAFMHIQRAWGRVFQNPFWNEWLALSQQFKTKSAALVSTDLAFGLAVLYGALLVGILAWRRQWPAAVFSILGILLPLSTNTYSMVRFVAGLAPLLILFSLLLAEHKWLFYLALPAFVILDILLLPTWISRSYYLM
jgi:hypothetical protein